MDSYKHSNAAGGQGGPTPPCRDLLRKISKKGKSIPQIGVFSESIPQKIFEIRQEIENRNLFRKFFLVKSVPQPVFRLKMTEFSRICCIKRITSWISTFLTVLKSFYQNFPAFYRNFNLFRKNLTPPPWPYPDPHLKIKIYSERFSGIYSARFGGDRLHHWSEYNRIENETKYQTLLLTIFVGSGLDRTGRCSIGSRIAACVE